MSFTNDTVYEQQCEQWHNDLLNEFEDNNTSNLMERLNEIENVVNKECNQYSLIANKFKIGSKQRQNLLTLYNKDLREHTIVSHNKCATEIKNVNEYKQKARNKLNRWKPKVFGDHVLYQIIFVNAYNYCYEIGRSYTCQWDDASIKNLFITIFINLLDAKIRFKKTRDVPLILSTVFSTNTRFRRSCIYFLEHFNEAVSWNIKSGKKAADKAGSFKKCLEKIRNYQNVIIPPPIIINAMDITENNRSCDVYYISVIKKYIIQLEQSQYMYYNNKLSASDIFSNIITEINSYLNNSVSFWSVTPRKQIRSFHSNFYNDDDGDIIFSNVTRNIPSVINTNAFNENISNISNNSYTSISMNDSSRSIPGLNGIYFDSSRSILCTNNNGIGDSISSQTTPILNNNRSISYDTTGGVSSLSRLTSNGSSVFDETQVPDLPGLPMLNDTDNLQPLLSGESMHYDNIQTFNPNINNQFMDVEHISTNNLYDNSQQQTNNYNNLTQISQEIPIHYINNNTNNNNNNAPQLINQLPPPMRNDNNYTQINPHINQYMPPPPLHTNSYNNNYIRNNSTNFNNNNTNFGNNNYNYTYSDNRGHAQPNQIMQYIQNNNNTYQNNESLNLDSNFTNYNYSMPASNSTPIECYEYNNMNQMQMDSMPNTCSFVNDNNNNNNNNNSQLEQTMNTINYNYDATHYSQQMDYNQIL